MKSYLHLLKELQEIDKRIHQIDFELAEIPGQLENSGAEYLTLSRSLEAKEKRLAEATKERQTLEKALQEDNERASQREARLYAIKTQKEYQATLKEISEIKKSNKERETRVLSLLEEGEKLSPEITQLKSQIADMEGGYRQIEGELKNREKELKIEREKMVERRPALLQEFPKEILKRYENIGRRYDNPLVAVERGVCQGCNMNIPPQVYNEMLRGTDLKSCPNCHRLLFVEPKIAEPKS